MDELFGGGIINNIYGVSFSGQGEFDQWCLIQEGLVPSDAFIFSTHKATTGGAKSKKRKSLLGQIRKGRYDWLVIDSNFAERDDILDAINYMSEKVGIAILDPTGPIQSAMLDVFPNYLFLRLPSGKTVAIGNTLEKDDIEPPNYFPDTDIYEYLDRKIVKNKVSEFLSSLPPLEYPASSESPLIMTHY